MRRRFYQTLLGAFPVFFLLHWNGVAWFTYYWALEAMHATDRFVPQVTAALISSIVIFAAISVMFELVVRFMQVTRSRSQP